MRRVLLASLLFLCTGLIAFGIRWHRNPRKPILSDLLLSRRFEGDWILDPTDADCLDEDLYDIYIPHLRIFITDTQSVDKPQATVVIEVGSSVYEGLALETKPGRVEITIHPMPDQDDDPFRSLVGEMLLRMWSKHGFKEYDELRIDFSKPDQGYSIRYRYVRG